MKLTAPTSANETAQAQAQNSNCDWDSLIGGGDLEDQLDAALEQGDQEDTAAGSLIDTGEQAAEPAEEAESAEPVDATDIETEAEAVVNPWPNDPRIDSSTGMYVGGWHEIEVPVRKRNVKAIVLVIETQDLTWQAGFCVDINGEDAKTHPLSVGCDQWATAQLAVADAVEQIDSFFALHVDNEKLAAAVRQDLGECYKQVRADDWKLPTMEEDLAEATATCNCQAACPACNCEQAAEVTITEVTPTDSLPSVDQPRTSADDADALERIRSAQDEVDRLHEEWEDLKNEAKDAKKRWEVAVKRQGELIKELTTPLPLFDGGKKGQGQAPQIAIDAAAGTKRVKLIADLSIECDQPAVDGKANEIIVGKAGDIVTAYTSLLDGELFLMFGQSDRWLLQPEEYEEVTEEPAAEQTPASDKPTCSWRELPVNTLEQYGAREKAIEALQSAGHAPANLGQLSDAMDRQTGGNPWYKDVGIRKNYQVEIENALTKLVAACEEEQA